jgi:two-component system chemotaxis sensor kinase CheA
MPEQFEEEIREFLIESAENLARLDCEIVELEHRPDDAKRISSVFRTIHTIKGTCGFFGFEQLGSVAHITENILCQVRDGQCRLTPALISLVLEAVDRIKALLAKIEVNGCEGPDESNELRAKLEAAQRNVVAMMQMETAHPESVDREAAKNEAALAESTIRVDVGLLDKLMNLVASWCLRATNCCRMRVIGVRCRSRRRSG